MKFSFFFSSCTHFFFDVPFYSVDFLDHIHILFLRVICEYVLLYFYTLNPYGYFSLFVCVSFTCVFCVTQFLSQPILWTGITTLWTYSHILQPPVILLYSFLMSSIFFLYRCWEYILWRLKLPMCRAVKNIWVHHILRDTTYSPLNFIYSWRKR